MKIMNVVLAGGLLMALGIPALAQKQTPPEGGTPKDFTVPAKQTFKLTNGLEAVLVPYGSLPKVTISVRVRVGNVNESAQQVWLADIMGDLMKEGTTSRSAQAVAEEAAGMGGSVNIGVSDDQTNINGTALSEFGPAMVRLLADIVRNPLFPESELNRLKNNRVRQVTIAKSQPGSLTMEQFRRMLYPDHPYGRVFPTPDMLQGFTVDDVLTFYRSNFGARRTVIYVAGRFDARGMERAIREAFGGWNEGPAPVANVPKPVTQKAFHLIDRPGAAQSTIHLGLPVIHPAEGDYVPLLVTNSLLGGSFGSRITSNIREEKGYTYSPFSQVSTRYRDAYWVQTADVTTDVTGPSLKEIFYEIDRLKNESPSTEELKGIQNYVSGTFVLQNSSPGGIINQLWFLNLHGLKDDYLTNFVRNVHRVTPAKVQEMVKKHIREEDMTLVVTGDKNKVEQQILETWKPSPEGKQ